MRQSGMSLDVIPEAIHEYMHENLNDSHETEEQKTIGNFDKWITKFKKEQTEWALKFNRSVL